MAPQPVQLPAAFAGFAPAVLRALRSRLESVAVQLTVQRGSRDENRLSDLVFHFRHPARRGAKLKPQERDFGPLSQEWLTIRDTLVRPPLFRSFFAEYDLRFLPGDAALGIPANPTMSAAQKALRTEDVLAIAAVLNGRLVERFDAAVGANRVPEARKITLALRPRAVRLSTAQIALIREFFDAGGGRFRWSAYQQAFERFANGELRNPARGVGAGEPDGPAYFLFAEFALLCVDSDIHKVFWERALRAMVKTQEIFVQAYRPDSSPSSLPRCSPPPGTASPGERRLLEGYDCSNFTTAKQRDEATKRSLRTRYDRMDGPALRRAMRDNLRAANRLNTP